MKNEHFILIKHPSETISGKPLTATQSCQSLLDIGIWPLFQNTKCRLMVRPGNSVLIYAAGQGKDGRRIIASAYIAGISPWSRKLQQKCPIFLEGIPVTALQLDRINYLSSPVLMTDYLNALSFIPKNRKKWGVSMMGGMRSISQVDYNILSEKVGPA